MIRQYLHRVRQSSGIVVCTAGLLAVVFAGPKISVDKTEYNAGAIMEGSKEKVQHSFIIKNTGDEPLRIKEVRPG